MILTGSEIKKAVANGDIVISDFNEKQINPNSYNYHLGSTIKVFDSFDGERAIFKTETISDDGFLLKPDQMYLANTKEVIGSKKYAMSLIGRSSTGRLGLFLQTSANLGHTTSEHRWTLEIVAAKPIIIYAGMRIGQVSFWTNLGQVVPSPSTYSHFNTVHEAV